MAKTKKNYLMEDVTIKIPLLSKNEPDTVFVSVNEKTIAIKKGEDVTVPRYVADMIIDSQEQNMRSI